MTKPYNIILFGASGYTGQSVLEYLIKALHSSEKKYTWAIAGRSESKISSVIESLSVKLDRKDLSQIPILVCDVRDEDSIVKMTSQTDVLLNVVGPYRFYGEAVIKACLFTKTHHLDISGEPEYLERMQLKYNEEAKEKGVYIVGSCGFDSIPADLGTQFLSQKFDGDVNDVETYLEVTIPQVSGPIINYATYESAIYGYANAGELKDIRKQLYNDKYPTLKPRVLPKPNFHKSDIVGGFLLPFPGSDRSVINRTQRACLSDGKRPIQVFCYLKVSSWLTALKLTFIGFLVSLLTRSSMGIKLLLNHPRFFTFGAVLKDKGPSSAMAENTNFQLTLVGRGWPNFVKDREDEPSVEVKVRVSGNNIGYGSTCAMLISSCLILLEERDKMPKVGGVYTPGYAFASTTLVQRLSAFDVHFVVESHRDLF